MIFLQNLFAKPSGVLIIDEYLHWFMKRFIKYFLVIFGVISVAFVLLLHCSSFQKICLLGILRCGYKEVRVENFHGGVTEISWGKILCKSKKNTLAISNFELKWHPWRLVFARTLSVDALRCDIDFTGDCDGLAQTQVKHAGWFLNGKASKRYSILENLRCPVKLDVASVILNLAFSSKDICLKKGHLKLKDMHPGNTGTFCYDGTVTFSRYRKITTHGEFLLQESTRGNWEKIRCSGEADVFYKEMHYPRLTFNGIIDGTASRSKEEIKAEIHCGQANDFLLTGEWVKDSDRVYDFKWQGFFDHSLLKFLNMSARPVLSILTEGDCVFNWKRHTWTTHTNLSILGKHFEAVHPSLKTLPCLSFKAQLDADIGREQIDLKQYKFVLKEKGAPRLFLDVASLHPLTYTYKGNKLGMPSKEDTQIFEINFYETPFEVFNLYLKQYGVQVMGNLQSGNVSVGWDTKKKCWSIATFQPICAQIRQAKKDDKVFLKDVVFRLSEKCALNRDFNEINYEVNGVANDAKRVSFFKISPKGHIDLKNKIVSGEGAFFLDNVWAKNLFNLEPFGVKMSPDLYSKMSYNFEYKKEKLSINQLKFSLNSSSDKTVAVELRTEQSLHFSEACWEKTKDGDVASLVVRNYPLDFVQCTASALSGVCNGQFSVKKIGNKLQCSADVPLSVSNFKWRMNSEDQLSLNDVLINLKGECDENLRWSAHVGQVRIVSDDEQQPLLLGNCDGQGVKTKLESSHGQVQFSLDKLCAQPIMLKYPGFVGDFNSHWGFDKKQAEANGRLHCQPLGSNFTLEAKSSYKQEAKPLIKTALELQAQGHSSDVYIDTTWDKNKSIDCQIHSEKMFMKDIVQCYEDLKRLGSKFASDRIVKSNEPKPKEVVASEHRSSTSRPETLEKSAKREFPFQGLVRLDLKSVNANVPFLENISGTIVVKKDAVRTENLCGTLCAGKIELKSGYDTKRERLEVSARGADVDINRLSSVPGEMGYSIEKYGQMVGKLDLKLDLSGEIGKPFSWTGVCDIACKNGYYKIFNPSNKAGQAIGGIASTLGLLLSANVSGMGTMGFLTSYIQRIPYNEIACSCSKDTADKVVCKGWAVNSDLAVSVDGYVGMQQGVDCAKQPLAVALTFSAPANSPFLNYFSFDASQKDNNGYYVGPNCKVGGVLGNPDYSSLVKLVTSVRNEKTEPREKASPVQELLKTLF